MDRLVNFLFSVSGIVASVVIAAVWIASRPRSSGARRFLFTIAIAYLAASTYIVPATISRLLATGYRPFEPRDVSGPAAIVVLGAGVENIYGWTDRLSIANADAAARVLEAWRVYRLIGPRWVITSGGVLGRDARTQPSSENMRDALVQLGVPRDRIMIESASLNTHEDAVLIAPMLAPLKVDRIVLVTSGAHMRRSMGAFRAAGVAAVPAIAPDAHWLYPWRDRLLPTTYGLGISAGLAHELIGIPYYWIHGWWR